MHIFEQERDELPGAKSYRVEILLLCLYTELRGDSRSIHELEGKKERVIMNLGFPLIN